MRKSSSIVGVVLMVAGGLWLALAVVKPALAMQRLSWSNVESRIRPQLLELSQQLPTSNSAEPQEPYFKATQIAISITRPALDIGRSTVAITAWMDACAAVIMMVSGLVLLRRESAPSASGAANDKS